MRALHLESVIRHFGFMTPSVEDAPSDSWNMASSALSGSAPSESAEMRIYGNADLRNCGNADLRKCGFAEMRVCGNAEMRKCGNAEMPVCGNAEMRKCGFAEPRTQTASKGPKTNMIHIVPESRKSISM